MNRQIRRIEKAIDQLCKAQDDAKTGLTYGTLEHVLDKLRDLKAGFENGHYK